MTLSHVELYEALKPTIGEKAAGMIAEVVPPAENLATREHLTEVRAALEAKIAEVVAEMREGFAKVEAGFATLRGEIHAESKQLMRWMLALFIPVWAGTWAATVAIVLKG